MLQQGTRLFGLGRYFWDAIREINPGEVRADLDRHVTIGFFGRPGSGRHALGQALFGDDVRDAPTRRFSFNETDTAAVAAAGALDFAFLLLDAREPDWSAERRLGGQLAGRGCPTFLILTHADALTSPQQGLPAMRAQFPSHPPEMMAVVDPRNADATRGRLIGPVLNTVPTLRLALAHQYPRLRRQVTEDLIREASRVNAQFALMSSLPTLVPVLGMFLGGMADILVLTKNQAMLVFKLAALYGRNVDDRMGVLREILPVIGGAFVWRTAARTAVGLAPAPISALPKAAIAYFGTYTVGQAARYYYERGDAPPPEVIRGFQAEARRLYASLNDVLKQRFSGPKAALPPAPPPDGTA